MPGPGAAPSSPAAGSVTDRRHGARVAIALGSNLAIARSPICAPPLPTFGASSSRSASPRSRHGTRGRRSTQPRFLNAAATGDTTLDARHTARRACSPSSDEHGRERPFRASPRTLDLDLILYGDRDRSTSRGSIVPHPRFRERAFVLDPLAEIAPDLVDPVTGRTIVQLQSRCCAEAARRLRLGEEKNGRRAARQGPGRPLARSGPSCVTNSRCRNGRASRSRARRGCQASRRLRSGRCGPGRRGQPAVVFDLGLCADRTVPDRAGESEALGIGHVERRRVARRRCAPGCTCCCCCSRRSRGSGRARLLASRRMTASCRSCVALQIVSNARKRFGQRRLRRSARASRPGTSRRSRATPMESIVVWLASPMRVEVHVGIELRRDAAFSKRSQEGLPSRRRRM